MLAAGCYDYERAEITYLLSPDLTGQTRIAFFGIHSTAGSPEEAREEMAAFYRSEREAFATNLAREWFLREPTGAVTNQGPFKCDAKLVGAFDDVCVALAPLARSADFLFRRNGDTFLVHIRWRTPPPNMETVTVFVELQEAPLDSNAHTTEETEDGTVRLAWRLAEAWPDGIRFKIRATATPE